MRQVGPNHWIQFGIVEVKCLEHSVKSSYGDKGYHKGGGRRFWLQRLGLGGVF
jgi:hypothetical protein